MTGSVHSAFREVRLAELACIGLLTIALAGCSSTRKQHPDNVTTGSIPQFSGSFETMNAAELASTEKAIGAAYDRNPKDKATGLRYANVLRMTGKNAQALAVMQQVAIAHPADRDVLAAYGKAQAAAGQLEQALATITRAQTPDRPDWRLYSAEGAVLDQLGRSDEARQKYRMALDAQPNEPSVMSNLGMSYVLSGDLRTAETYMRSAAQQPAADSRVRQNLALVVGLQGRFAEAEQIARHELSQQQADANITYLRSMLSQQNSWAKLAEKEKSKPSSADRIGSFEIRRN
ncbi:tetratricopeptide repeat protein [Rhizobium sp. LC145]|jgi:Flp pilus assembly protein TadD|uniref:tetratricopeptide repeat protein n=1 Tax=Rhizobium sp. LC145 TaxID=1120688 RepID=UPI00062A21C1|nr:tetratricopeptide repeat protein [Rhizobium sp. LC145]KKX31686.1 pilus assembly protein TadD [Rhizobium sp. LC145]TKT59878.1 tetratricopeptide repeat protein [Rhizobiaceae bacterium LC148]